jgi:hypothetical protein
MVEKPENLNTHHLRQFREEIFARMDALEQKLEQKMEKIEQKMDKLDHKAGDVALTLVGMERDMRRLTSSLGTLGAAVDEIESRIALIEKRDEHPRA